MIFKRGEEHDVQIGLEFVKLQVRPKGNYFVNLSENRILFLHLFGQALQCKLS